MHYSHSPVILNYRKQILVESLEEQWDQLLKKYSRFAFVADIQTDVKQPSAHVALIQIPPLSRVEINDLNSFCQSCFVENSKNKLGRAGIIIYAN